jgi:hypothetical protein
VGKRLEAHQSGGRSLEGGFHGGTVERWGLGVDWPERLSGPGWKGRKGAPGWVKLEEVTVGHSGGWRRLVPGRSSWSTKVVDVDSDGLRGGAAA